MKKWFLFLVCASALVSCEKDIELHPDLQEPKLVVEAQIESTQSPYVILSNSLDYFSTIDAATLNNTYVHNAKVTITVGTKVYPLNRSFRSYAGRLLFLLLRRERVNLNGPCFRRVRKEI
jgi:hypothetical protein